jgi:peptide deformylase
MDELKITEFGNPILRKVAKRLNVEDIHSEAIQKLISEIKVTVGSGEYGVGLAAPQVGESVALSVIAIKPTPTRPNSKQFIKVIINPEVVECIGDLVEKWEGCMSFGTGEPVFAQTMRHETIKVKYHDENAELHEEELSGLPAHVFQHETDHLNGVLFVDHVKDSKTWMNASEYKKMLAANSSST